LQKPVWFYPTQEDEKSGLSQSQSLDISAHLDGACAEEALKAPEKKACHPERSGGGNTGGAESKDLQYPSGI